MKVLNAFLAAVQFLTRVPVPGGLNRSGADPSPLLQEAVVFFPLVGGLIGLVTGAVIWAASHLWPMPLAVLIGLAAEAVLTGAFHEDAVADCCDGFGGGWSREDVLRIMKDSRIGSFGMLGLALALLLRAGCLAAVDRAELLPVVVASSGVGRWAGLLLMAVLPPLVDREGLARDVGSRIKLRDLAAGTVLAAPAVVWYAWLEPIRFGCGLAAVLLGAGAWAWYVRRRLGGTTGDCLGFACYLGQVLVLLAAAAQPVSLAAN
jgi:adenosylcobinamide-GDP ribazoletransferase